MSLTTPCDFAKARYLDMKLLKLRWNYLIFFLAIMVVLFCFVSIVLLLAAFSITAAVSGLGTLLSGGIATWLATQRKDISDEEQKAFDELVRVCGPPTGGTRAAIAVDPARAEAIKDQGWFRELDDAAAKSVFSGATARHFMAALRDEARARATN
jgi:hypothetical protein